MATASFPMYDMPEVRSATDALWTSLAKNLIANGIANVPEKLQHDKPVRSLWSDTQLLISQCCGYDVVDRYKGLLKPVATPKFKAQGCLGENYCSAIVVAVDCQFKSVRQMAGKVAVINGPESHSGMSSLRHLVSTCHLDGKFFSDVKVSGSHIASLDMVRHGLADVAAIDSVTLSLLDQHRDGTMDNLKILGTTYHAPAPPYVVSAAISDADLEKVQDALVATFNDPELANCREQLLLDGLALASQEDYWLHEAFKDHAQKRGFPTLQ